MKKPVADLAPRPVGNDQFEGYSLDLIDGISRILNFTYKFEIVPDNNYGSFNPETEEWNGLIKHLLDRVCIFCLEKY